MEYKASEWGYAPHGGQTKMVCPKCGNDTFVCPAQAVSTNAEVWCYEHICSKCGHYIGIEVKR